MSNLVDYARQELDKIGEDEDTKDGLVKVVQAFADMGHSGASAMFAIPMLERLLRYKPLTALTDDPAEWQYHDASMWPPDGVWQSRRDPEAFSTDAGKSYYLLSEREAAGDIDTTPLHRSETRTP